MKTRKSPPIKGPAKTLTGITGFDEITGGGLPAGRTSVIVGGPGSGKTLHSLQFLAQGALACDEPGICVAFEEAASRILSNADSFCGKLPELRRKKPLSLVSLTPTTIKGTPAPHRIIVGSLSNTSMVMHTLVLEAVAS